MTNIFYVSLSVSSRELLFDLRCDCTANQKRVNKYIKFHSTNMEYLMRIVRKNQVELIA